MMIYMLDTANIKEIERLFDLYPIDGVTTNPTIIAQEQKPLRRLLVDIRRVVGDDAMLHVQPIGSKAEDIVAEAMEYRDLCKGNYYAKIPVTPQGIKAMQLLKQRGVKVTATAIFTQQQALIAAKAGADFWPRTSTAWTYFLGWYWGGGGHRDLHQSLWHATKVLAASFKNVGGARGMPARCHAVTIT